MTVSFGIRLPRYPENSREPVREYYDRTLASLSDHITSVWLSDHLQGGDDPGLESWMLLAYLAGRHPRFTYSHLVCCQSYRNPALLAKMAATLQTLTGGRFILSLGAGWLKEEYEAYGYRFDPPAMRVEQLAETIQIVRALWTQAPATFHGRHYHIEQAYCSPRPDPLPPILVGTNGPRALRVAAQFADAWNWDYRMSAFEPAHAILQRECARLGRDPRTLTLTLAGTAHFPDHPADYVPVVEGAASSISDGYVVPEEPKLGPTPADAIAQLRPFIARGVRHFQVAFVDQRTIDRFCTEVAPALAEL